jgi:hypothetical protein
VFAARYELNSYIVFRKRLVSKRLRLMFGDESVASPPEELISSARRLSLLMCLTSCATLAVGEQRVGLR